jgi:tetratricopeptide (TPR) repeat protein
MVLFRRLLVCALLMLSSRAFAYDFVKRSVPGKWIEQIVPEDLPEPEYPSYFNDFDKAKQQAFTGRYRRALAILAKAKGADAVQVSLIRSTCLHSTGRDDEALKELTGLDPRVQVLRARIQADLGHVDQSIQILTSHLKQHPNSLAGHYWLGQVSEQIGDLDAARKAYGWFVEDQKFLDKWIAKTGASFDSAEDVTIIGRAIDRWATITGAYQGNTALHNTILSMFVRAYDEIDRQYWPAHVAAGEYYLTHDDRKQAVSELKSALEANPNDARALAALAEVALSNFNFDGADELVESLRDVNPTSTAADLLEARNLLQQRRPKDAQKPVRHVLDQQPKNLEALGLMAATYALQLQDDKTADSLKQVDQIDPDNATAYCEVAEQLGAMRQYPRAAAMYQKATERAPWWTAPRNGLGLLYTQSGDEELARSTLDAAHNLDPFNLATTNYLRLLDDLAKFSRSETDHFVVFYDPNTDPVIPEYFGEYLESIYKEVTAEYHQEPPVKTYIEVFPTHEAFSVRTTGSPWIGTVGASTGRVIALCAPREAGKTTMGAFNWSQVLRHEFTHTVTLAATDNRIAHWLTEGLAVLEEHSPLRWEWIPMLYHAVKDKTLFGMEDLTWGFVRPKRPMDRQLAYAESFWICKFIQEKNGHDSILKLLAEFKQGKSQAEAFQTVLGKSLTQFQDEFFRWTEKQIQGWGYDDETTEKVADLKEKGESLVESGNFADALGVWEEVAKLRPVDKLPHMRLAALYLKAKRPDDAVKQLEALHAVELNDNRYAKRIARVYRGEDKIEPAIKYAVQSVYIDPYDSDAHELLAELYDRTSNTSALARERRVIDLLNKLKERQKQD